MGLSKKATRAAIRHLATAGLVSIVRKPGRGLEVTLLDATTEKET
jgi:DNA-binding GntR family transcriptional regulator